MWPFRFAMHRKRGLRNMVIYLLSTSPKNGVELMDGVESITRGWWRPTAGSIYPLLQDMVKERILTKREEDGKYELTPNARTQMDAAFGPRFRQPQTTGEMVNEMHGFVSYMEDVKGTDRDDLEQHRGKLRSLAKRLADLAGEDNSSKEEQS